jgi:hypothetical protein
LFEQGRIREIAVRIDVRESQFDFLNQVLRVANEFDLLIRLSETGELLHPSRRVFLERLRASRAFAFVKDPAGFLNFLNRP